MPKKLNRKTYFGDEMQLKYMGVSQFKAFEKCEACALAEIRGEYQRPFSTALLIGSYCDAVFDGHKGQFRDEHPEMFKRDGELKADYAHAELVIARIRRDPVMRKYATQGRKQVIMTGEIEGVPVKIMTDILHDDCIVDRKIMASLDNVYVEGSGRISFIEAWGYDLQGAVYQEIVRQNTGKKLPFIIAAASKEKVPDIGLYEVPQENLDVQLDHFREFAPRYQLLKQGDGEPLRCEKCDYCKQTRVLTGPVSMNVLYEDY